MHNIIKIYQENIKINAKYINNEVDFIAELRANASVVVIFGSPECKACVTVEKALSHFYEDDDFSLVKIDVLAAPDLVDYAGITSLPTTILYLEETEIGRVTGNNIKRLRDMLGTV